MKATEYGTITGKINWVGDKPDLSAMTEALRKGMVQDRNYCLSGKDYETTEQTFRIGKNGGLGNVFVWIEPEEGYYFDIPAAQLDKFKNTQVMIGQPHCAFLPHASVLFPSYYKDGKQEPSGQKLLVENDAKVSHNSKVKGGALDPKPRPDAGAGQEKDYVLKPDKSVITVSCGVHTWMKGYIRAFDHPYAAVSSVGADPKAKTFENDEAPDFGTYKIEGVPVGAKGAHQGLARGAGMARRRQRRQGADDQEGEHRELRGEEVIAARRQEKRGRRGRDGSCLSFVPPAGWMLRMVHPGEKQYADGRVRSLTTKCTVCVLPSPHTSRRIRVVAK